MKRAYKKPMISFEEMCLDMPIAANCETDFVIKGEDQLREQGWFAGGCLFQYDEASMGDDKVCLYTSVTASFSS